MIQRLNNKQRSIVKKVINNNFTFSDLSNRFINVDSSTGNIFCPFHENHNSPAAKMYWDDENDMWILHCFGECHRNYTAFDYVELILCEKYQQYKSPLHFLKEKMSLGTLKVQLKLYEKESENYEDNFMERKEKYINDVFATHETVSEYIEALYMG